MLNLAIYEYKGVFPGIRPHGNSKNNSSLYSKTPSSVLTNISNLNKLMAGPEAIYQKMNREEEFCDRPKDTKQIRNKKYNEAKKEHLRENPSITFRKNLADHIQVLENMVHNHPYVQQVINFKNASPAVILYTAQQIHDIKHFCIGNKVVLGVDKTFNLSDMHVTATVFKHQRVVRRSTGEHPLFIGPALIHGHSTTQVFNTFFSALASELGVNSGSAPIAIGSDDEKAMRNAIKGNFNGYHVLCTRHLRENITRHLGSVGVCDANKRKIIESIFSERGLCAPDTPSVYLERLETTKKITAATAPGAMDYMTTRIFPLIEDSVVIPYQAGVIPFQWTNNNAESINHQLKQVTGWVSQSLPDLIHKMFDLVDNQYRDLENALIGKGNFRLAAKYEHYYINPAKWSLKTKEERQKLFKDLVNDRKPQRPLGQYVTSTDGKRVVMASPCKGRKPDQRKRKRCAKTSSIKKAKISM